MTVTNSSEWKMTLVDLYYLRKVEELKKAGIPRCVSVPALIKLEAEISMLKAYV